MVRTRRDVLRDVAAAGTGGLAGCLGDHGRRPTEAGTPPPPTRVESRYRFWGLDTLEAAAVSGGPPIDGIQSVDQPTFHEASDAESGDDAVVFGIRRNGEPRAYPREILVHHEIVNDTIGDDAVSVTYCPLTGTVQGFARGGTTFGVTGSLVNSNLIMYDRATESWWPQVQGTAIDGDLRGDSLEEFRVYWTTWGRWRERYPDSLLLTADTGYARDYGNDPYGGYSPRDGYYANDVIPFTVLTFDEGEHPKEIVIGARTEAGAIAFNKDALLTTGVLRGMAADMPMVAVRDDVLATGYVYENPEELSVQPAGAEYLVEETSYPADDLPLGRHLAMDAMWFAWSAYFPTTAYVDSA